MKPLMSRRRLLAGAVGMAGAVTLAACGEEQVAEETVAREAPAETPVPAQKVVTAEQPAAARVETAAPAEKVVTVEPAAPQAELSGDSIRHGSRVGSPRASHAVGLGAILPEAAEHQLCKVEPIGGDYWDALSIQAAAGSLAELVLWDGWLFNQWRGEGITVPINDTVDKMPGWDPDEYYWMPNIYTENGEAADHQWPPPTRLEGPQHGFSYQGWTAGFLYNITMVERLGLGAPTEDWTWNDLLENSMKARDPEADLYGIDAIDREKMWMPLCFSAGATLLRGEGDVDFTMFDDGGDEGFQFTWDLIHTHDVAPPPEVRKQLSGEFGTVFEAGKQAYWMSGRVYTVGFGVPRIQDRFEWSLGPVPKNPRTNYHGNIWGEQYHAVTNGAHARGTLEADSRAGPLPGYRRAAARGRGRPRPPANVEARVRHRQRHGAAAAGHGMAPEIRGPPRHAPLPGPSAVLGRVVARLGAAARQGHARRDQRPGGHARSQAPGRAESGQTDRGNAIPRLDLTASVTRPATGDDRRGLAAENPAAGLRHSMITRVVGHLPGSARRRAPPARAVAWEAVPGPSRPSVGACQEGNLCKTPPRPRSPGGSSPSPGGEADSGVFAGNR